MPPKAPIQQPEVSDDDSGEDSIGAIETSPTILAQPTGSQHNQPQPGAQSASTQAIPIRLTNVPVKYSSEYSTSPDSATPFIQSMTSSYEAQPPWPSREHTPPSGSEDGPPKGKQLPSTAEQPPKKQDGPSDEQLQTQLQPKPEPRSGDQLPTDTKPAPSPQNVPFIDDDNLYKDFEQYEKGSKLVLTYQSPRRPYGRSEYPNPPGIDSDDKVLSEAEKRLSRTGLVYNDRHISNPIAGQYKATVYLTVMKIISGGPVAGTQVILCKVDEANYDDRMSKKQKGTLLRSVSLLRTKSTRVKKRFARSSIANLFSQENEGSSSLSRGTGGKKEPDVAGKAPVVESLDGERLTVGQLAVLKVYDAMFYPFQYGMYQGPWKVTSRADQEHSREAGAYKHLWTHKKTGYPHLAPQYYGSWAIKLTTTNSAVKDKQRFARAIIMEYIEGTSIEELCFRTAKEYLLVPRNMKQCKMADGTTWNLDRKVRLDVFKELLGGYVNMLHHGVNMRLDPQNILLTGKRGDEVLKAEQPRVVAIDYVDAMIDDERKEPLRIYQIWEKPPHPWGETSLPKMQYFHGWFPHHWKPGHFDSWLIRTFGQLDDPKYTDPNISKNPELSKARQASKQPELDQDSQPSHS
ncbi:uncharacterized protein CCOS01_03811 [Colletotrichum costaricense]|uniref:Protein kinase domain-containing protein n=1 Tax=Colletotrichum costaricense TaxID=1209916 RepID=A0AAJ0E638_9PEZI|nr:uncharacterized protein CCOS01_03811 [Colletotrichum costaricense]KAK1535059.1 hypothetical protein CCOS01_03811 [Colletotrichum costaricense]